ncbi:MAG: Holliday junction branch migration protein RuvA [Acidobacteriaceae bacterium]
MISHLRGQVLTKQAPTVVLDIHGVGYEVLVTVPTYSDLPEAGGDASLFIHTHVREDQLALFGFATADEKKLFERLISVSGIGPKLAITVLSGMSAAQLVSALRSGETARLTKIPGIGKKTAERMVLELRDKLADFATAPGEDSGVRAAPRLPIGEDVLSALTNLGYQRNAAERATDSAVKANSPDSKFDVIFRAALGELTR